ncbi:c-type cytochrome [Novosphingobium sp. M1R2S20]|uniref:Cytochrome c family protein n=1 Tax=Novosphingobium rhizovicinum TaxID=3228928 RepID=A0ABV3RAP1_9SPHN
MMIRRSLLLVCLLLSACGQGSQGEGENAVEVGEGDPVSQTAAAPTELATRQAQQTGQPPAAFAVCRSCHTVVPGRHGIGPSLAGIWGKEAASLPGFGYSEALRSSGIVWNAETLDTWLKAPTKMVPGTRMIVGIPNAEGRKAIIDYLETLK